MLLYMCILLIVCMRLDWIPTSLHYFAICSYSILYHFTHMWMHLCASHILLAHWTLHYHKISPRAWKWAQVWLCVWPCESMCAHVTACACLYLYLCVCPCMRVCVRVCVCACVCVCVCVCVFPDGDKSEWLGGNRCQLVLAARKTEQSQSRYLPVQNAWQTETCI